MSEDQERLLDLLREAERLAVRIRESMVGYMIRMALLELDRDRPA